MSPFVKVLQDGGFTTLRLHNLLYEIYTIIVVFNMGKDRSMDIIELTARLKKMHKYSKLSDKDFLEMLVTLTNISFSFSTEIADNRFIIKERICL